MFRLQVQVSIAILIGSLWSNCTETPQDTLKLTRDANKAAVRAAESAQNAVDVTWEIGKTQLRAYVNIANSGVTWENNRVISANIAIKNCGQTPARGLHHWQAIEIGECRPFANPEPDISVSLADVGAGVEMNWPIKTRPLDNDVWAAVRSRKVPMFVIGEIRYIDVFAEQHFTRYRLILGEDNDRLNCYPKDNESD